MTTFNARPIAVCLLLVFAACVEKEPDRPTAEDWPIIKRHLLKTPPSPRYKVNAQLEDKVVYLGLDIDSEVIGLGQPITLKHYWQVKKSVGDGWRLFVHINDQSGDQYLNVDHVPVGGRYPVSKWKPGHIIEDIHTVTVPPNWTGSRVRVTAGLWKGDQRMKPSGPHDEGDRIIAADLPIRGQKSAPAKAPARLIAAKTRSAVKVDGRLNEKVWSVAKASTPFVNTMTGAASPLKTTVKVAWDDKHLYIAFDNQDEDVWSTKKARDAKLWSEEVVEVMIDADGDRRDYIELQVNPNGAVFDSFLPAYRKNDNAWNSKIRAAVHVDGTLNKRSDKDKGWTVEIALPLADVWGKALAKKKATPKVGSTWKVNFFRFDAPQGKAQIAMGWSPPLVGDFHKLDRFGEIAFADEKGKVPSKAQQIELHARNIPNDHDHAHGQNRVLHAATSVGTGKKLAGVAAQPTPTALRKRLKQQQKNKAAAQRQNKPAAAQADKAAEQKPAKP